MAYCKRLIKRILNRLIDFICSLRFNARAFTIFIIYFIVFILISFNYKSSAHSTYYDAIQTFTGGKPWVLYQSEFYPNRYFLAVSPDDRKAKTINGAGTENGITYGIVGFTEKNDNRYWVTNNYYELNFTNGEFNGTFNGPNNTYAWQWAGARYNTIVDINYSTYDYNLNVVYDVSDFAYQYPFIENNSSDVESWSFDTLDINGGDVSPYWQNITTTPIYYQNYRFYLDITTNGVTYSTDINNLVQINEALDWFYISIPRQALSSYFVINNNQSVNFYLRLKAVLPNGEIYENDGFDLGTYTLSLTTQQVTDINNESDKYTQGSIEENQKETNQRLEDLNGNIMDSNVDDDNISNISGLSGNFNVNDVSGIDDFFQVVYNAFCTNTIQSVTFDIPFTNKQWTISPDNVSHYFPESLKSIVATFSWGVIGLYVLKDIREIFNKINEGKVDKVGSDVKKEVL